MPNTTNAVAETQKRTPMELVKERYPNAYEDDDGETVSIRFRTEVTELCPHCNQKWKHLKIVYPDGLGSGGNSSYAWENAAKNLSLV